MRTLFNFLFGIAMIAMAFILLGYWISEMSFENEPSIIILFGALGSLTSGIIFLSFIHGPISEHEMKQIVKAFNISGIIIMWLAVIAFIILVGGWTLMWLGYV